MIWYKGFHSIPNLGGWIPLEVTFPCKKLGWGSPRYHSNFVTWIDLGPCCMYDFWHNVDVGSGKKDNIKIDMWELVSIHNWQWMLVRYVHYNSFTCCYMELLSLMWGLRVAFWNWWNWMEMVTNWHVSPRTSLYTLEFIVASIPSCQGVNIINTFLSSVMSSCAQ